MRTLPETSLDWVLLAVGTATAIIIAVALQDFFLDSRAPSHKLRAMQDVSVAFAVTHFGILLLRGGVSPPWAIAGIGLYVAATLLFLSAIEAARRVHLPRAFVEDPKPRALITSGPFRLVRHPFYLAYGLAWLAAPVATWGPVISLIALIQIVTFVVAARREERQLEELFGEGYRAYKRKTGMFLPYL